MRGVGKFDWKAVEKVVEKLWKKKGEVVVRGRVKLSLRYEQGEVVGM